MQRPLVTSPELAQSTASTPLPIRIARLAVYAILVTAFWGGRWHRATVQSPLPGLTVGSPQFVVVVIGALLMAGLALAGPRGFGAAWRGPRKWISVGLLGLSLLSALTAPLALDPVVALKAGLRLAFLWFVFAAINQLASDRDGHSTLENLELPIFASLALVLGVAFQALIAVLQFVRQGSVGLAALGEMDLDPVVYGNSVLQVGGEPWLRAYGLSAHPNVLGGYLAIGVLVLVGFVVLLRSVVPRAGWTWGVPLLAASVAGLIVTFSRSAWLGFVVGLVFLALAFRPRNLLRGRSLIVLGVGLLVALVVFASVGDLVIARFIPTSEVERTSIEERLEFHALALEVIGERPLGVGGDNFPLIANQKLNDDRQARPHNVPLLVVAELGPLGGALWLILALVPPIVAWRRLRHVERSRQWALVFAAALVAVAVISLFDHYFWSSVRGTTFWAILLGLWSVALPDGGKR